jgi:hypothetical protein
MRISEPNVRGRLPYMDSDWFASMKEEVRRSSVAAVAAKIGFHRSSLSQVLNGCGPYGDGRSSTKQIELAWRQHFEQLTCPHTDEQVGIEHCRKHALGAAPTHNPMSMQQWRSCQQCQYKPKGEKA